MAGQAPGASQIAALGMKAMSPTQPLPSKTAMARLPNYACVLPQPLALRYDRDHSLALLSPRFLEEA